MKDEKEFRFVESIIKLKPTVGVFITMNPGSFKKEYNFIRDKFATARIFPNNCDVFISLIIPMIAYIIAPFFMIITWHFQILLQIA